MKACRITRAQVAELLRSDLRYSPEDAAGVAWTQFPEGAAMVLAPGRVHVIPLGALAWLGRERPC